MQGRLIRSTAVVSLEPRGESTFLGVSHNHPDPFHSTLYQ